jgi:DNA-binding transcriptional MerR regulator
MRISQLAERSGVPVSTVRYYERIGLLGPPSRSSAGYRDYDDQASTRLTFIARSRRLGLTCDQVAELLPVWAGVDCVSAHARVGQLIDAKRTEISARIAELSAFAAQLDEARAELEASTPPAVCCDDLTCCVPAGPVGSMPVDLGVHDELPVVTTC